MDSWLKLVLIEDGCAEVDNGYLFAEGLCGWGDGALKQINC